MNRFEKNSLQSKNLATVGAALFTACILLVSTQAGAWLSKDQTLELHGFADSTTHQRVDYGLSKQRFRGQLEFNKQLPNLGAFTGISLNGTIRLTYDAAYDFNSNDFGDDAGGPVFGSSSAFGSLAAPGADTVNGLQTPWGASPVSTGAIPPAGGSGFGFNTTTNPNVGLKKSW